MNFARSYAERTARFGPKWIGFEAREAVSMELPCDLKMTGA